MVRPNVCHTRFLQMRILEAFLPPLIDDKLFHEEIPLGSEDMPVYGFDLEFGFLTPNYTTVSTIVLAKPFVSGIPKETSNNVPKAPLIRFSVLLSSIRI